MPDFFEFFAGGGMVRAALSDLGWNCVFANDFDRKKGEAYQQNWGGNALKIADIKDVTLADLPGVADLAWASFPCQDLSLAGGGAGLKGDRSGTFWPFWRLMEQARVDRRSPKLIALENVCGTLTSHGGKDFAAICNSLRAGGYRFGAVVIDAAHFVPQSRPRLFVLAVRSDVQIPSQLVSQEPSLLWHPRNLRQAYSNISTSSKDSWLWWNMPVPAKRNTVFSDVIEESPSDVKWHTERETAQLLSMMSDTNLLKVAQAKASGVRKVGAVYKRTRMEAGQKVQRAEVRFDDIAGCLRTPAGGSSRQTIIIVQGAHVRSRLISSREAARLMGLWDSYILPNRYNEAYHLAGDGVVVPVVQYLAEFIFSPILGFASMRRNAA